ncbi:unnamed protein product [Brassica rapa subsp. trilocularis]
MLNSSFIYQIHGKSIIWRKTEGNKTIRSKFGSEETGGSVEKMKTKWWEKLKEYQIQTCFFLEMQIFS